MGHSYSMHQCKALLMAENAALRAENHFQKQKRARKKGFIRKGGSMTIQEERESIERSVVTEQSHNNIENVDPAIPAQQQETVTKRAPSRCSKCGSFDHKARRCSS